MNVIDVKWSAAFEVGDTPIVDNWLYLARPWAEKRTVDELNQENAETLATEMMVSWLTGEIWHDMVGYDDDDMEVVVTIHSPDYLAGDYRVTIERKFVGKARKEVSK